MWRGWAASGSLLWCSCKRWNSVCEGGAAGARSPGRAKRGRPVRSATGAGRRRALHRAHNRDQRTHLHHFVRGHRLRLGA